MSELTESLRALSPSKGDMVSRLPLTDEERRALDELLLEDKVKDVDVAALLAAHGHDVTAYAVTYYKRKLQREQSPDGGPA